MTESRELTKFTLTFACGTLFSRLSGLLRDMVWFATIPNASIGPFLVAFKFPNMLRDLVGEGASNAAFVPVFSETIEKESEEAFRDLVSAAMSAMLIVLAVLTLFGVVLLPYLFRSLDTLSVLTTVDSVTDARIRQLTALACWTFPYLFFIGMTVFAMGPLFVVKHYATPAWSPILLNVALIGCCLGLRNRFADPAYALVLGIWLGGIAQMTVQYLALAKYAGVWRFSFNLAHPGIRAIFWLLIPVLIGQAAGEVNKLVDTLFAAILGDDKVKALFTANRLVGFPLSVFGIAVSVAILPTVARAGARDDFDEIRKTLMHGLRQTFFLVFPALLGLMALREPIVRLLYQRGEFSATDTQQTATALLLYATGLIAFVWVKVLVTGFYAVKDTKTPVLVASASMLLNVLLNCVLVGPLGYKGLALATTISFTINFVLLYALLCGRFGNLWDKPFIEAMSRMAIAAGMMLAVAYGTHHKLAVEFPESRVFCVIIPVACAVVVYAGLCHFLDVPDLRNFLSLLSRKKEPS